MARLTIAQNNNESLSIQTGSVSSHPRCSDERNDQHSHAPASSLYRWTIMVLLCYQSYTFDHLINDPVWSIHCIVAKG